MQRHRSDYDFDVITDPPARLPSPSPSAPVGTSPPVPSSPAPGGAPPARPGPR